MITEEKARALDAYDLAKELEQADPTYWRQNIELIHKVSPVKLKRIIGFLSLEGGMRGIRIYALETSCLQKHFVRNAAADRDSEIRKRAIEILGKKRRPMFRVFTR